MAPLQRPVSLRPASTLKNRCVLRPNNLSGDYAAPDEPTASTSQRTMVALRKRLNFCELCTLHVE
jgi:hypothetical protein